MQRNTVGRPKDIKKRIAILDAAKNLFLEHGYDGCSMEKIAKQAGVSKLTVYSHFKDKADLFTAAIDMVCDQRLPKHLFEIDRNSAIEDVLLEVIISFNHVIYSEEAIKLSHLMASVLTQNVELTHMFYAAGPGKTVEYFEKMFADIDALDLLDIDHPKQCSTLFISLISNYHYQRVMWQLEPIPSVSELKIWSTQQLAQFLKIYPLRKI